MPVLQWKWTQKVTVTKKDQEDTLKIIPPEVLLEGYAQGIFPMARSRNDPMVNWYTAKHRGIIPVGSFHASRKLRRIIRSKPYRWTIDEDFRGVIERCADRDTTWISNRIIESFKILHDMGHAHSVEVYLEDRLVAGTYGVSLRSAFFAESMFQSEPEMGKIALFHCHERLKARGFLLWDAQFFTPHLSQFGCMEIDADEYDRLLTNALQKPARFDQ